MPGPFRIAMRQDHLVVGERQQGVGQSQSRSRRSPAALAPQAPQRRLNMVEARVAEGPVERRREERPSLIGFGWPSPGTPGRPTDSRGTCEARSGRPLEGASAFDSARRPGRDRSTCRAPRAWRRQGSRCRARRLRLHCGSAAASSSAVAAGDGARRSHPQARTFRTPDEDIARVEQGHLGIRRVDRPGVPVGPVRRLLQEDLIARPLRVAHRACGVGRQRLADPAAVVVGRPARVKPLPVARTVAVDHPPELVPVDLAEAPVAARLVESQFRIRQAQPHRVGSRERSG